MLEDEWFHFQNNGKFKRGTEQWLAQERYSTETTNPYIIRLGRGIDKAGANNMMKVAKTIK